MKEIQRFAQQVTENIEQVIVGKADVVQNLIIALLCEGHVLLEDVPGVGKTILARSLAVTVGADFRRLQCTPDCFRVMSQASASSIRKAVNFSLWRDLRLHTSCWQMRLTE